MDLTTCVMDGYCKAGYINIETSSFPSTESESKQNDSLSLNLSLTLSDVDSCRVQI